MADQQDLIEALRSTSALILAIRKTIAATGHLESMVEIDTLLAVARAETDKRLAMAIARSRPW